MHVEGGFSPTPGGGGHSGVGRVALDTQERKVMGKVTGQGRQEQQRSPARGEARGNDARGVRR